MSKSVSCFSVCIVVDVVVVAASSYSLVCLYFRSISRSDARFEIRFPGYVGDIPEMFGRSNAGNVKEKSTKFHKKLHTTKISSLKVVANVTGLQVLAHFR